MLPEDRAIVEADIAESLRERRPFDVEYRVRHPDGSIRHVHGTGMFQLGPDGRPLKGTGLVRDVTDFKNWESSQKLLIAELNHRVKNMLAVVQSVARQTRRSSRSLGDFVDSFEQRVHALAGAHDLLTRSNWVGADLAEVAAATLAPFEADGVRAIQIAGPPLSLSANATVSMTMALHELCTNAVKYGALSGPEGRVALTWSVERRADGERLVLEWTETGGPPVTPPERTGFGTLVLRGITGELGGDYHLDWRPEGLRCTIKAPIDSQVRA